MNALLLSFHMNKAFAVIQNDGIIYYDQLAESHRPHVHRSGDLVIDFW